MTVSGGKVISVLFLAAVVAGAMAYGPKAVNECRYGVFSSHAREWLRSARQGDAAALASRSPDRDLVERMLDLGRQRPALLDQAIGTLRLESGARVVDTVMVVYTIDRSACGEGGAPDKLLFTFHDTRLGTEILWMGMEPCRQGR